MPYDSSIHHRRSIRLKSYDYAQNGGYFVTICTYDRLHLFGEIIDSMMRLSDFGKIVETCWCSIPEHFHHVQLDAFVVMPNHLHGIIAILETTTTHPPTEPHLLNLPRGPASGSLGAVVGLFKQAATRQINRLRRTSHPPIWQRSYYEHVIRNLTDLQRLRAYIDSNPARWAEDRYYSSIP